jgi:sulfatase modifying factor 1
MTTIIVKDALRQSIEAASDGRQTVIRTTKGYPSYFNVVPAFKCEEISDSLGTGTHPAFIINGVEKSHILVGTYQAVICDGQALSLPFQNPKTGINFDAARTACVAAGPGFHMMSNWEWAAVALWMTRNGYSDIHGNTNRGKSHKNPEEAGIPSGEYGKTLTGSGPEAWRHDGSMHGIADLVGNVWEWIDGLKLSDGKIIMPCDNDFTANESSWPETGAVINCSGDIQISNKITKRGWADTTFQAITAKNDQHLPLSINQALLCPCDGSLGAPGHVWADNSKGFEAMPFRGGIWNVGATAGLAGLCLVYARSVVYPYIGFRPAFIA